MKKICILFFVSLFAFATQAQVNTPGTGVHWNMDSLAVHFPTAVTKSGNQFSVSELITFSKGDTFFLDKAVHVAFDSAATMTFEHATVWIDPESTVVFTAADTAAGFGRIRLDSVQTAVFNNFQLSYGSGISLISSQVSMANSTIEWNKHVGANPSGALSLLKSNIKIDSTTFMENARSALTIGATGVSGVMITNSKFLFNNYDNGNYPQVNIGTGSDSGIVIRQCTFEGKYPKAGAIGFLNITNTDYKIEVSNNTIKNNRYGIAVTGRGISGYILNNTIDSNNIEGLPMLGGSGLNFLGDTSIQIIASGNIIRNNLWGVTVQATKTSAPIISLGRDKPIDALDIGGNDFKGNGHGDTLFAVYNNTPDTVWAQNNFWDFSTADSIEATLFHHPDADTLGWIIFNPFKVNAPVDIPSIDASADFAAVYPNPLSKGASLHIRSKERLAHVQVLDIQGRVISRFPVATGASAIDLELGDLQPGVYLVQVLSTGQKMQQRKIVVSE